MSSDSEPLETSLKQNRDAIKVVQPLPRVVPIKLFRQNNSSFCSNSIKTLSQDNKKHYRNGRRVINEHGTRESCSDNGAVLSSYG